MKIRSRKRKFWTEFNDAYVSATVQSIWQAKKQLSINIWYVFRDPFGARFSLLHVPNTFFLFVHFVHFLDQCIRYIVPTKRTVLIIYLLTYLLTYSMKQSPTRKAKRFAASQEIAPILLNPKVHSVYYTE
jgi:hypothetical protein